MEKHFLNEPYYDLVQFTIFICLVTQEGGNGAELLVGALRSRRSISGPEMTV